MRRILISPFFFPFCSHLTNEATSPCALTLSTAYNVTCSLTWSAVLCALLVDHLFDSSSKQHPWGVMVKGLEGFTGAVGLLGGDAAGSLLSVSWGAGVSALLIGVSLAVYFSVSLALGERAERPLLPHPFHSACMLGIQLPPFYLGRSLEALSRLDYFTLFFPLPPPAVPPPVVILVVPLPDSEARSLTASGQSGAAPAGWDTDNYNPPATSSKHLMECLTSTLPRL